MRRVIAANTSSQVRFSPGPDSRTVCANTSSRIGLSAPAAAQAAATLVACYEADGMWAAARAVATASGVPEAMMRPPPAPQQKARSP